jgi:hypothetical protein
MVDASGNTVVNSAYNVGGESSTKSASDTKIEPVKSIITDAPQAQKQQASGGGGGGNDAASSKIGLGSFGITAGVDDSLALMNMGILTS